MSKPDSRKPGKLGNGQANGRPSAWGWWEDLDKSYSNSIMFQYLTDGDEVPEEHPVFDPSPPIQTFGLRA